MDERDVADSISKAFQKQGVTAFQAAERFVKYAWLFGAVIFGLGGWVGKMQWDSSRHTEDLAKLALRVDTELAKLNVRVDAQRDQLRDQQESSKLQFSAVLSSIDGNTKRLGELKETADRTAEMWFMKEHGISNKEEFERINHYPAPAAKP